MNKKSIIIASVIGGIAVLALVLALVFGVGQAKADLVLDLNFDDPADGDWYGLHGENIEGVKPNDYINGGTYHLLYESVLKHPLSAGELFHVRIQPRDLLRTDSPSPLFFIDINAMQSTNGEGLRMYFDNKWTYRIEPHNTQGFLTYEFDGKAMLCQPTLLDVIIALDETSRVLTAFVAETESADKIVYWQMALPDTWQDSEYEIVMFQDTGYWQDTYSMDESTPAIDFVRFADGSLTGYLRANIPQYKANRDKIDTYLGETPEMIDESQYMMFGQ